MDRTRPLLLAVLIIGRAAAVMLLGLGRIAGVGGSAARATGLTSSRSLWPIAGRFVIGLSLGIAIGAWAGDLRPGPAIVDLALMPLQAGPLVAAMLAGFVQFRLVNHLSPARRPAIA